MTETDRSGPLPRRGVAAIGGHMEVPEGLGRPGTIRLCSNENPLGPSPLAIAAATAALARSNEYPEAEGGELVRAIGRHYGVDPARVRIGGGSDTLLLGLVLAFAGPGDEVMFPANGYARNGRYAAIAGATPVPVADRGDFRADLGAMASAVSPRTRIVIIANPDNPSGAMLTLAELRQFHAALPERVLLVLDGAYADYVRDAAYGDGGLALAASAGNVVVSRTFSKIFALGWMTGPPALLAAAGKAGATFPVTVPTLAAGLAAIGDTAHIAAARRHNDTWLPWLAERLSRHSELTVYPSQANFQLVRFPDIPGGTAADCTAMLARRGLLVRRVTNRAYSNHLRISIGPADGVAACADLIDDFLLSPGR
jgi:histidinol-phosphate aminotransferase